MTWFRVDDRLPDHRKTRRAGTAAMGLWVLAGAWSSGHLTDGWVPREVALRYGTTRMAGRLVESELWVAGEVEGEPGWWFHEWTEHQPTREQVQLRRKADAKRQQKRRTSTASSERVEPVDSLWSEDELAGRESASRRDSAASHGMSHGAPDPTRPVPTSPNGEVPPGDSAQTIVGEWIDRCAKRPPKNVTGQIARHVKAMLAEGIDPDDIRRGLADWMTRDVHPSVLPSLVNTAMNRIARSPSQSTYQSPTDANIAAFLGTDTPPQLRALPGGAS